MTRAWHREVKSDATGISHGAARPDDRLVGGIVRSDPCRACAYHGPSDETVWPVARLVVVSPGNPLKENGPALLSRRMERAHDLMDDPRVRITDIEAHLGTRYTAQTLARLMRLYPGVRFVWLMGADNLAQFHLWQDWDWIMDHVPVGVLARPDERISARMSPAARRYRHTRISGRASQMLGRADAPAWCFVNVPLSTLSSSAIRAAGDWEHPAEK